MNFHPLAEDSLEEVPQRLQVKDIPCHSNEMLGRGVKWCLKHVETPEGVKPLGEI